VSPHLRQSILGVLFAGAAWLAVFGDKTPTSVSAVVPRRPQAATVAAVPARAVAPKAPTPVAVHATPLLRLVPRDRLIHPPANAAPVDLFLARNWTLPLPVAIAPPPPAPMAPPLPYTYAGKKWEAGRWEVYLMREDSSYIARNGASLDGSYRVDRIEPPTMTLTYTPLGQQQTLSIGE